MMVGVSTSLKIFVVVDNVIFMGGNFRIIILIISRVKYFKSYLEIV